MTKSKIISYSTDPLVPLDLTVPKFRKRASTNRKTSERAQSWPPAERHLALRVTRHPTLGPIGHFIKKLLMPLAFGAGDVNLITGTETSPNITQSETFTAANPDNPNQIVVAYNDSRGRNQNPINISGASVSTDGGNTFTRLTTASGQSPFANTLGDPVVLYNRPTATWYTVWLDTACGGQGLGGYKSTTPSDPTSWTHFCVHTNGSDDRESGWADNNPSSPFSGGCTSPGTILMSEAGTSASPAPVITELLGTLR